MKSYEITEDLFQAIVGYLGSKSYKEVFTLIEGLKRLKPIVHPKVQEQLDKEEPKA